MLSSLLQRVRALFYRKRQAEDLADELIFHHSSLQEKLIEEGLSPEQAARKARQQIGDAARWQERLTEQWQFPLFETLRREVGLSCWRLRKIPGFTLTVVLTLAVGIGATTAIFSLVEGVLLRPLPFPNAKELVLLSDHVGGNQQISVPLREIEPYTRSTQSFSSLGGYTTTSYEFSDGHTPEQIDVARFTSGVFPTLGIQPILGRVFTTTEENAHQPLAVLSYGLWQDHFGGNPGILGGRINLNRRSYTIIGVMPRSFEYPLPTGHLNQARLWVPMSLTPDEVSDQHAGVWGAHIVARLREGVTTSAAALDADRVSRQVMRDFPVSMSAIHIRGDTIPLLESNISDIRGTLKTLFAAVTIVLLVACINVAGLLLVRAIRRRREYAIRLALGARPSTIVRESLLEGLILSFSGGILGVTFAATMLHIAVRLLPETMPRLSSIVIDGRVLAFALALVIITGAGCSLAPSFAALKTNLMDTLKDGNLAGTGAESHTRLRSSFIMAEIAIALVLLSISGMFLRSLQRMHEVDLGFNPDHVLVSAYQLPANQYPSNVSVQTFNTAIINRLSGLPGTVAAGITDSLPATNRGGMAAYTIEGRPVATWKLQFAGFADIDGDYFHAMGIRLLSGRTFTADDRSGSSLVVIVSESMAKHAWPGQSAVGKRLHAGNPRKGLPWATVVGIVADTKMGSRDKPSTDQWYVPVRQPAILYGTDISKSLTDSAGGYIVLRSKLAPEQMISSLHMAVAEIDPQLALQEAEPLTDVIANVEAPRRFNTGLITGFALCAFLLAVTGIYTVVAFSVSLRRHEIAIRMALGAQRRDIVRAVFLSGAKLAFLGSAFGLVGSLATSRLVRSFLFEVSTGDPAVHAAAVLVMLLAALIASALPARRASSANPAEALRSA